MSNNADGSVSRGRLYLWGHPIADWIVPLVIFIFAGVVSYLATTFERAPDLIVGDAMQPRVFPIFIMAAIAILNCVLILQIYRSEPKHRKSIPWQTWVIGCLFAVFWLITRYSDLFIAMAFVLFAMSLTMGERRLWMAALIGVGTSVVIFFFFDLVLKVRFPRGWLTEWYYG